MSKADKILPETDEKLELKGNFDFDQIAMQVMAHVMGIKPPELIKRMKKEKELMKQLRGLKAEILSVAKNAKD